MFCRKLQSIDFFLRIVWQGYKLSLWRERCDDRGAGGAGGPGGRGAGGPGSTPKAPKSLSVNLRDYDRRDHTDTNTQPPTHTYTGSHMHNDLYQNFYKKMLNVLHNLSLKPGSMFSFNRFGWWFLSRIGVYVIIGVMLMYKNCKDLQHFG